MQTTPVLNSPPEIHQNRTHDIFISLNREVNRLLEFRR